MSLFGSLRAGLRGLLRRQAVETELDDEVRHYLQQATEERIRAGMRPEAAAREARLELGSLTAVKEAARSGSWEARLESAWNDLRYAVRSLRRNPGFTLVAMLTLALGLGATTAIFSAVNAVILRPLPYADPGRLAVLWTDDARRGFHEVETSFPTFRDWQAQSRSFAELAVFSFDNRVILPSGDEPERMASSFISERLFPLLGVKPMLGRGFTADDERQHERVVVLSNGLWRRRFGADPGIVGKSVWLDGDGTAAKGGGRTVRVIGVMPQSFYFPTKATQLWEPITTYWRLDRESGDRFFNNWRVMGRLAPGASFSGAQIEMDALGRRLTLAYPSPDEDFPGFGVSVVPMLDQVTGRDLQRALWILMGSVGFVLLIACVNIANLQLARGAARGRELAVRVSLGAGRLRLVRQLLTESLVLALSGGVLGLLLAGAAVRLFAASAPPRMARLDEIRLDPVALLFTAGLVLLAGILFGIVPAWKLSSASPGDALKAGGPNDGGGRGLFRTRGVLVAAECALAIVLLTGAGLLLRSALRLQAVDPGFDPSSVLLVRVTDLPLRPGPRPSAQAMVSRQEAVRAALAERLAALPGVKRVGAINNLILRDNADLSITIPGRPGGLDGGGNFQLMLNGVSPGFFPTMGVPLRRGRLLTRADALEAIRLFFTQEGVDYTGEMEPVVVNEAFVRRFFPEDDPLGKRFYIGGPPKIYWYEIVGVVGDMRHMGLERRAIPEFFSSALGGATDMLVRTTGDSRALAASIRQEIRALDKTLMVLNVTTVDAALGELTAQRRFQTSLLAAFALLALSLAAVGVYGLLHYQVSQRSREIGVRLALGASTRDVLRLIVRQGMALVAGGVIIGLAGSLALTRVMQNLLFEIGTTDPLTFVAVPLLLGGVALCACYLPARRAARVDPLQALKSE